MVNLSDNMKILSLPRIATIIEESKGLDKLCDLFDLSDTDDIRRILDGTEGMTDWE